MLEGLLWSTLQRRAGPVCLWDMLDSPGCAQGPGSVVITMV